MYIDISEHTVAKKILVLTAGYERPIYGTNIYDKYFHDILY